MRLSKAEWVSMRVMFDMVCFLLCVSAPLIGALRHVQEAAVEGRSKAECTGQAENRGRPSGGTLLGQSWPGPPIFAGRGGLQVIQSPYIAASAVPPAPPGEFANESQTNRRP